MIVFAIVGARLGVDAAEGLNLPEAEEAFWFFFSLIGFLFGLIVTPYFSVRPFRRISRRIREMPIEVLFTSLIGGAIGLALGLMLAYPLAQLNPPFNQIAPAAASIVGGYLGMTIFGVRSREIWEVLSTQTGSAHTRMLALQANRQLLLDTSVLIDGRIVDIARTGFLGGTLVIPRFVLTELHQVADSSDTLRRNRGRRGLVKLNELQRNNTTPVKIIEDDIEGLSDVDNKLVALAQQMDAALVTNDYPLSKVAEGQGVPVLNINLLANAVRATYIPGETFPIHVIQTGSEENQGVGYLEDGTMVIVENGKRYMDRTIKVTVTKFINREAGRIYFAVPESDYKR
jgi:uncharacterized protein YacL